MTGLLVSVRNRHEAQLAVASGADVIDVKEPNRGSLGPADLNTCHEVVRIVKTRAPVSVALGELLSDDVRGMARHLRGVHFAKVALAGCFQRRDWPNLLRTAFASLPPGVTRVAVAYADHLDAMAPSPREVLQHATALECAIGAARPDGGGIEKTS